MPALTAKEEGRLADIERAIRELEAAVERFTAAIGPTMFIPEAGRERFRYPTPSSFIVQVLKAVRVVSGLNALVVLLRAGYTQEMGVILRTIDDFLAEIEFLYEAHLRAEPTSDQKRFVDLFFAEEGLTVDQLLKEPPKTDWVSRKKIQASEARLLQPDNPPAFSASWGRWTVCSRDTSTVAIRSSWRCTRAGTGRGSGFKECLALHASQCF